MPPSPEARIRALEERILELEKVVDDMLVRLFHAGVAPLS